MKGSVHADKSGARERLDTKITIDFPDGKSMAQKIIRTIWETNAGPSKVASNKQRNPQHVAPGVWPMIC